MRRASSVLGSLYVVAPYRTGHLVAEGRVTRTSASVVHEDISMMLGPKETAAMEGGIQDGRECVRGGPVGVRGR